jgi:hypothetical protein
VGRLDIQASDTAKQNPLDAVIFRGGEAIRETWSASAQVVSSWRVNNQLMKTSASLTLLITNFRLIAIREMGLLSSNYDLFTEMDLESIGGVSLREVLFQTSVVVNYRAQGGTAELALFNLDELPTRSNQATTSRSPGS